MWITSPHVHSSFFSKPFFAQLLTQLIIASATPHKYLHDQSLPIIITISSRFIVLSHQPNLPHWSHPQLQPIYMILTLMAGGGRRRVFLYNTMWTVHHNSLQLMENWPSEPQALHECQRLFPVTTDKSCYRASSPQCCSLTRSQYRTKYRHRNEGSMEVCRFQLEQQGFEWAQIHTPGNATGQPGEIPFNFI